MVNLLKLAKWLIWFLVIGLLVNLIGWPITLLLTAIIALIGTLIYRRIFPEKRLWWQFIMPNLSGASFLAFLVQARPDKIFDVFEHPLGLLIVATTLLILAINTSFVFSALSTSFSDKRKWRYLAIPIFTTLLAFAAAVSAFGLDYSVQTDLEKINAVIDTAVKAVEQENPDAIEAIISDNYRDSYHNTKKHLMYHCRARLSGSLVEKNKKRPPIIEISPPNATVTLTVIIHFDKQSYVYQEIQRLMQTKAKINLQKQQDGRWLINRVEILEINMQRAKWRDIR